MTKEQREKFEKQIAQEKRIAELEQENAELKHTTATLRQEKDNSNAHAKAMEIVAKTRTDQLTKAKEIIKEFMKYEINEYDGSLEMHFEELKNKQSNS